MQAVYNTHCYCSSSSREEEMRLEEKYGELIEVAGIASLGGLDQ